MVSLWKVISSNAFIAGLLLILTIKQAIDGNAIWAAINAVLFLGNLFFAMRPVEE